MESRNLSWGEQAAQNFVPVNSQDELEKSGKFWYLELGQIRHINTI